MVRNFDRHLYANLFYSLKAEACSPWENVVHIDLFRNVSFLVCILLGISFLSFSRFSLHINFLHLLVSQLSPFGSFLSLLFLSEWPNHSNCPMPLIGPNLIDLANSPFLCFLSLLFGHPLMLLTQCFCSLLKHQSSIHGVE
jgi:hypothetical protein